jgi:hypothetical protein
MYHRLRYQYRCEYPASRAPATKIVASPWLRPTVAPWRLTMPPWRLTLGTMEAHQHRTVEAPHGALKAYHSGLEPHCGALEAHHGGMHCKPSPFGKQFCLAFPSYITFQNNQQKIFNPKQM